MSTSKRSEPRQVRLNRLLCLIFTLALASSCSSLRHPGKYQKKDDFRYQIEVTENTIRTPEHLYAYKVEGRTLELSDDEGKFFQCRIVDDSSDSLILKDGKDKTCPIADTYVQSHVR